VSPGGRVIAVEADSRAADDARHNLAGADGVGVRTGRVAEVLRDEQLRRADLVVLDPPRAGAGPDVLGRICALRPRRVAYVACDPASLARDVASLQAQGYRLRALRAFDLFPMTRHVECVAVFEPAAG
jgi:tRNA/tmRNA/rRNA uracil-C5-methylase (TrmA/RlmC/RlmD family)